MYKLLFSFRRTYTTFGKTFGKQTALAVTSACSIRVVTSGQNDWHRWRGQKQPIDLT